MGARMGSGQTVREGISSYAEVNSYSEISPKRALVV